MDALAKRCARCQKPISENRRGRPQKFCSDRCRQAHRKIAHTPDTGPRYRTGRVTPKSASEASDAAVKFKLENLSSKSHPPFNARRSTRSPSRSQMVSSPTCPHRMGNGVAIVRRRLSLGLLSSDPMHGSLAVATTSAIRHLSTKRSLKRLRWPRPRCHSRTE